ncbi:MAG TPA: hypothetical protein VM890_09455, partial [Longimicrobium sp.]|nr:hypothetical protein [Longimicrobium sp.]
MTEAHPSAGHPWRSPRRAGIAATVLAALLAAAVYANAVRNGYAIDDEYIVLRNPAVHGFGHLRDLLLGSYWPNASE